jgi:hypothetical protein
MAIAIDTDEAVRQLEEAARLARDDSFVLSKLWLDRVAELEDWKGNKLALTAFATAALAKATEPDIDPLSLIDRSGDPRSYNARLFARDVLVPNARRLGFLLGTAGPDPLAGSPWFGPERIDEIDKWRSSAKQHADNLVGWLAGMAGEDARAALVALVLRRSEAQQRQLEDRKKALAVAGAVVPLPQLSDALDRFIGRNPEEGRRGAAAAAAAFSAAGRQVVARPINDPGQVDVDVMDRDDLLLIGIEVKQRPATEQDALDIAAGAYAQGATRAILCAFGQGALRLPDSRLVDEADTEFGVMLHVVYSVGELIRLAALTGEDARPAILRDFPRDFSKHLESLGGSQDALNQWKALTASWARQRAD